MTTPCQLGGEPTLCSQDAEPGTPPCLEQTVRALDGDDPQRQRSPGDDGRVEQGARRRLMDTDQHRDRARLHHRERGEEQQPRSGLPKQGGEPADERDSLRLVRRQRDDGEHEAEGLQSQASQSHSQKPSHDVTAPLRTLTPGHRF
jgi:hypothetical protein